MRSFLIGAVGTLLLAPLAFADKYVLDGGTSSACTSWSDACDQLTTAEGVVTRGETIWVGDGTYTGGTLNVANSGTSVISIVKATASSHGTETGWVSTYGDGQATIGDITLGSDYWTINGQTRDEADWSDGASYGFRITGVVASTAFTTGVCASNITLQYIDAGGPDGTTYTGTEPDYAFKVAGFDELCSNWYMGFNRLHNIAHAAQLHMNGLDGGTIEFNRLEWGWGKEAIRGQIAFTGITIRYNQFYNSCLNSGEPGEGCTAEIASWDGNTGGFDDVAIYGNTFQKTTADENSGGVMVVGGNGGSWVGPSASNVLIYNNTVVGIEGGASGCNILINGGTGNEVRNTLWYDCVGTPSATPNTSSNSESSTDVFVNYAAGDLHLTEHVAGTTLSAPYDEDMDGVTRGYNGTFDSGAYQYVDGGDSVPTVTTTTASSITSSTASSGGNVTADGGQSVTSRGVCYATTPTPTMPCTSDGTGTGSFTSSLTGLSASTTYYYRAFATNSVGTGYGSESTFETDAASMGIPVAIKGTVTVKGSGRTK